jgi:hypothetical protein
MDNRELLKVKKKVFIAPGPAPSGSGSGSGTGSVPQPPHKIIVIIYKIQHTFFFINKYHIYKEITEGGKTLRVRNN